jgi:hypothetical protein
MKTAFWQASLTASQAGENSQTNGLEHTIESSILTDLILRKTAEEERQGRTTLQETSSNQRRSPVRQMHLKIRIDTAIASTSRLTSILNSQKLRTEQMSKIQRIH